MKVLYCGLEAYDSRYTLQLEEWNRRVFERRNVEFISVPGETLDSSQAIVTGQVLDAHGRSYFGMSQMMNLVKLMKEGQITDKDVIFFEDMFQPGIESLPYIMNQVAEAYRPRVYVRCLAQTIDPDDFVHVWGMFPWMNLYEKMVDQFVDGVLVASEEMVAHLRIAGWQSDAFVTGLPFGKQEVIERVGSINLFQDRTARVGFAARWDQEKQPDFYMDLIEMFSSYHRKPKDIEFAIFSGGPLRSNNPQYIDRAISLKNRGLLTIHENLEKNEYYALLNDTRVLFNCALQDWVSNTVSEADSLGANVLYPAYRSFPEVFANDHHRMYVPWSLQDAADKLTYLMQSPSPEMGNISDYQDKTIDRTIDVFEGSREFERSLADRRYRNKVATPKY